MIKDIPQFTISPGKGISNDFLLLGITDFLSAVNFVGNLPYSRNSKSDYKLVLQECVGTGSTKHALLAQLCAEQGKSDIKLMTGIYEMNEKNTPGVGNILDTYGLKYIPEAHCYLKYNGSRYDFTRIGVESEPIQRFLHEEVITSSQIGIYKTNLHKAYLNKWLIESGLEKKMNINLEKLWVIREQCIKALSLR